MSLTSDLNRSLLVNLLGAAHDAGFDKVGGTEAHIVLIKNPKAQRVILFTAGLHGVEGYAGCEMLTRWFKENGDTIPDGLRVIIMPNLNPWGMANGRRTNANNVDLNRNNVDQTKPRTRNEAYDAIHSALMPAWSEADSIERFVRDRLASDAKQFVSAVTGGQYMHPDGLFYGGMGMQSEILFLRDVILGKLRDRAYKVGHIDIHTGIGKWGEMEVIIPVGAGHRMYPRMKKLYGDTARSPFGEDTSVSAPITGDMNRLLLDFIPHIPVMTCAAEFGTRPVTDAIIVLAREQAWWNAGRPKVEKSHPTSELVEHFAPGLGTSDQFDSAWIDRCYAQFDEAARTMLGWVES